MTYLGVFDLFKIGIGPSSSHSVGPMLAAGMFLEELAERGDLPRVARVRVDLFGSLALTGIGHGTDSAVLMGLQGELPADIDTDSVAAKLAAIRGQKQLLLGGSRAIAFREPEDLRFHSEFLPAHPNGLRFQAFAVAATESADAVAESARLLHSATYFSIGGGFVVREGEAPAERDEETAVPHPFASARELLARAAEKCCPISQLAWENEMAFRTEAEIHDGLGRIRATMEDCVQRGCRNDGVLPGGLNLRRRAPALHRLLMDSDGSVAHDPISVLDWVDLFALAVSEENAAGGRVVTAPTNGAAGILPAVMHYFTRFCPEASDDGVERFLLTAAVIGALYKRNASLSGAEVGCQGEVGVACSMAAGALTEVLGGSPEQVEQAAEIGMEHNLGLTCDPIRGLVQIPCIERNAMGAVKAINASRLALRSNGHHFVSLDRVIRVMKRTGADMSSRYKETSQGGLAVSVSEC
ncbi:MAG: L-serine ammonia-lyase [Planctomycetales bacterium]|nr:L-serine ammonia-lyase [Planctomycetales bacterium]